MIIFKNDAAVVQWDIATDSIVCHWKNQLNSQPIQEVVQAIIELQEANGISFYISDRSELNFLWSGYNEWYAFDLLQFDLKKEFHTTLVLDPNNQLNQKLLRSCDEIASLPSMNHIQTFRQRKSLDMFLEQQHLNKI
ncbi:hypothetical protein [Flammeovirga agarivorans]|uniref:Uncharacterized protein n=1 Tax=Flammeovirga agarivorans TaxID=2726742 RepID=A0A7X8XYJ4_9BACT|nr:hypothetical protein [Flammeovirga agarivorans]NLR94173.1 hypothetical protein [Flammeovirga agarivorans]